jgi:SAM-dependent methyltransferase
MRTPDDDLQRLYGLEVREVDPAGGPVDVPPCVVCRGRRARMRFAVESLRGGVAVCETCGLGRLEPMPSSEEVATFYPESYYGEPGTKFMPTVERLVRWVGARHIGFLSKHLAAGDRVLDVGCGRGVVLAPLADHGFEVHGVEISSDATEGADPRAEIRIAAHLGDAGYPEAFFRQVIIWHVLEHLPDPRETLVEVHRVLEPAGRLVVAVPNFSSLQARWLAAGWFHLDLPRHLYHFPLPALRRLLEDTGFEIESEHHFSLRQNPFGWIQSLLNLSKRLPRNGLYSLLHERRGAEAQPFSLGVRALLYAILVAASPLAIAFSLVAALLRRGATVHVVATRRGDIRS